MTLNDAERWALADQLYPNMFNQDPAVRVSRERIAEALLYIDTTRSDWGRDALLLAQGNPGVSPGAFRSGVDVGRAFARFAAPDLHLAGTNIGQHVATVAPAPAGDADPWVPGAPGSVQAPRQDPIWGPSLTVAMVAVVALLGVGLLVARRAARWL